MVTMFVAIGKVVALEKQTATTSGGAISKSEEIAIIRDLAAHFGPGHIGQGAYLSSLFSTQFADFVEQRILNDGLCDLMSEWRHDLTEADGRAKVLEAAVREARAAVDAAESLRQAQKADHDRMSAELRIAQEQLAAMTARFDVMARGLNDLRDAVREEAASGFLYEHEVDPKVLRTLVRTNTEQYVDRP